MRNIGSYIKLGHKGIHQVSSKRTLDKYIKMQIATTYQTAREISYDMQNILAPQMDHLSRDKRLGALTRNATAAQNNLAQVTSS